MSLSECLCSHVPSCLTWFPPFLLLLPSPPPDVPAAEMAMNSILNAADIKKALDAFAGDQTPFTPFYFLTSHLGTVSQTYIKPSPGLRSILH